MSKRIKLTKKEWEEEKEKLKAIFIKPPRKRQFEKWLYQYESILIPEGTKNVKRYLKRVKKTRVKKLKRGGISE